MKIYVVQQTHRKSHFSTPICGFTLLDDAYCFIMNKQREDEAQQNTLYSYSIHTILCIC